MRTDVLRATFDADTACPRCAHAGARARGSQDIKHGPRTPSLGNPRVHARAALYVLRACVRVRRVRVAAAYASRAPGASTAGAPGVYPTDLTGTTGVARKEVLMKETYGEEYFDRDAPSFVGTNIGTKQNPIPVFSMEDERVVGVTQHVSERTSER